MDDARQFIQARISSAGRFLLPSVRPLSVSDNMGDPLPAGSAVLLWHRGRRYLVSAAHVLDEYEDREYYIGTQTTWVPIPGPFSVTRLAPGETREEDPIDFGFKEVTVDIAAKCDGCHFLTADQIDEHHSPVFTPPLRSKYLAIGYPLNRFEYKWGHNVTVPGNLAFAGAIAQNSQFQDVGLGASTHVLLDLDPDHVIGPAGDQASPKLTGLSGGGVFHFPAIERPGLVDAPRLVAITIEQRRQEQLFIGTRISVVIQAINDAVDRS